MTGNVYPSGELPLEGVAVETERDRILDMVRRPSQNSLFFHLSSSVAAGSRSR